MMNEQPGLDDDQLRRQLREVPIPEGLRQRLQAIPDNSPRQSDSTDRRGPESAWRHPWSLALMLAAVLLLSVFGWRYLATQPPHRVASPLEAEIPDGLQPGEMTGEDEGLARGPEADTTRGDAELEQLLAAQRQRLDAIGLMLAELEFQQWKDQQLAQQSRRTASSLSYRETLALALAVSAETMHERLGATPVVQQYLTQVVRDFPETQGAARAKRVLGN